MSISLLCPTRQRPQRLRNMIESVKATACVMPEILCYVTPDDSTYNGQDFSPAKIVHGPRVIMSSLWNQIIPFATGDILMLCADDVIFRTPGWDLIVEMTFAAVPDRILLAYGDDGSPNGKNFGTLPFVSRRWVEVVGYFTGPGFSADFSDTWPFDVAWMIDRVKFLPILTEHVHWLWNKAEKDKTYQENEERFQQDRPDLLYDSRLSERLLDAEKLKKAIEEFNASSRG